MPPPPRAARPPTTGPVNPAPPDSGVGMGGRRGGRGPRHGGTHIFPGGFRIGVPTFTYPRTTTYVFTERGFTMPFGLQGKGLVVGLVLGFFLIPMLIRALR